MTIATTTTISGTANRTVARLPLFVDAGALAAELRRGDPRRGPVRRRQPRPLRHRRLELPPGADRRRDSRATSTTWSRRSRSAARHGAPILSRGGGTSLTGGCCNVAVVIDWSKYLNQVLSIDPEQKLARVQPGTVLDVLRTRGREASPDLRARPLDAHAQHAGRDDRQQLVRRPLADGPGDRPDVRPGPRARDPALRRHPDDRRGHERGGARADHRGGGRRGEIYARLKDLRDRYADEIRRRYPKNLPAPRLGLQPRRPAARERASTSPGRCRAPRGRASPSSRRSLHLVHSPAFKSVLVLGYPDVYSAGDHVARDPRVQADRPGGARRRPRRRT